MTYRTTMISLIYSVAHNQGKPSFILVLSLQTLVGIPGPTSEIGIFVISRLKNTHKSACILFT